MRARTSPVGVPWQISPDLRKKSFIMEGMENCAVQQSGIGEEIDSSMRTFVNAAQRDGKRRAQKKEIFPVANGEGAPLK